MSEQVRVRRRGRVRAPELVGAGGWIHASSEVTMRSLRGRLVLLDFWTSGCINCVHVLEELRPLEDRWRDELVVLGVHSPKFAHEADHRALVAAVARLGVDHPVLDDPELRTWDAYAVKAWPTLVLVDPEGYVVHVATGEGHGGLGGALDRVIGEVVAEHRERGTLGSPTGLEVTTAVPDDDVLRFPARVVATGEDTLLVADTGHRQVVELAADGAAELARIGSGRRGEPFGDVSGLALLPADVAVDVGYDLVVADRIGHRVHGVDRADGVTRVVAGTGALWRHGDPSGGPGAEVALISPTDVAWWPALGEVVIAQAGNHTLSAFDPRTGEVRRLAGTGVEGLADGPAEEAFLAQPSGLAVDGDVLWFVDAESSALRSLSAGVVRTAVGEGLFDFGHRDGPAGGALLQHPVGLAVLADGSVAIADTYNGAVRRYDPVTEEVSTLADGLDEPSDVVVHGGRLLALAGNELVATGAPGPLRVTCSATAVSAGLVELRVVFTPAPGTVLDERAGPATWLEVSASPPELLVAGAGAGTGLVRELTVDGAVGRGVLHVSAQAAACDAEAEHPVCRVVRQEWGVPVTVDQHGDADLTLVMAGPA